MPYLLNLLYFKRHLQKRDEWGYGGAVVTHSPPTSEVGGSNSAPYVGKLVVSYHWLEVYSTEL